MLILLENNYCTESQINYKLSLNVSQLKLKAAVKWNIQTRESNTKAFQAVIKNLADEMKCSMVEESQDDIQKFQTMLVLSLGQNLAYI